MHTKDPRSLLLHSTRQAEAESFPQAMAAAFFSIGRVSIPEVWLPYPLAIPNPAHWLMITVMSSRLIRGIPYKRKIFTL